MATTIKNIETLVEKLEETYQSVKRLYFYEDDSIEYAFATNNADGTDAGLVILICNNGEIFASDMNSCKKGAQLSIEQVSSLLNDLPGFMSEWLGGEDEQSTIETTEYNKDLDGVVITLSTGRTAQAQWNKEGNRLSADYGDERLERYTDWDSEDLTQQEQSLIDDYVDTHEWKDRDFF